MPPQAAWPPIPRRHASGQGRVVVEGQTYYLGVYGSPEATKALRELVDRIEAERAGRKLAPPPPSLTVAELCDMYVSSQAKERIGKDGENWEMKTIRRAVRTLIHGIGLETASEIAPRHLKAVRLLFVQGYIHPAFGSQRAQKRKTAHGNFNRCRAVFKWGAEESLIPASVYHGLHLIRALRPGECGVKENRIVPPVPDSDVVRTLPELPPVVRDMVRVQLLCGCRPGEICRLRPSQIDRTCNPWKWHLSEHKNAWRGHHKVVLIGPQAQEILAPYLNREICFSPSEAVAQWQEEKRRRRKSRVQPSQMDRSKEYPAKLPGDHYTTGTYGRAIKYAIERANRRIKDAPKVGHWAPNQLRHSAATRIEEQYSLEVARVILGHASLATTRIYAQESFVKAENAVKATG